MAEYRLLQAFPMQWEDANGIPLVGGTLEFQRWDTSASIALYSSSAGVSLGTSCSLNSLGVPETSGGTPCQLFGSTDDTFGYKIIRKDALGSVIAPTIGPIYTPTNASDFDAGTVTYDGGTVATALDAHRVASMSALVTGTWTGIDEIIVLGFHSGWEGSAAGPRGRSIWHYDGTTGGVQTTNTTAAIITAMAAGQIISADGKGWRLSRNQHVTASMFGARIDGTTDDQPSVQAALDYLESVTWTRQLYLERGVYVINNELTYNPSTVAPIEIIGEAAQNNTDGSSDGNVGTVLWKNDADGSILELNTADGGLTNANSGATGLIVRGITFKGNFAQTYTVRGVTGALLKHAAFYDCHFVYLYDGINLNRLTDTSSPNASAYAHFERCYFHSCAHRWIDIKNADDIQITSSGGFDAGVSSTWLDADFIGFNIEQSGGGVIQSCHFVNLCKSNGGAPLTGAIAVKVADGPIKISGNHFEQNYRDIVVENGAGADISANLFTKGSVTNGYGIQVSTTARDSVIIEKNTFAELYADTATYAYHIQCDANTADLLIIRDNAALQQTSNSAGYPATSPARKLKDAVLTDLRLSNASNRIAAISFYNGTCFAIASAPPSTANVWKVGDIIFNSQATEASALGRAAYWRCTSLAAGVPTWYAVGQIGMRTFIGGTPDFIGQLAVVAGVGYMATGVASSADWLQITP